MQETIVFFILAAAALIVFRHMAPRLFGRLTCRIFMPLAKITGWSRPGEKLAKTTATSANAGCAACNGCADPAQPSGCEMRIPIADIKKR
ncbi:hypothetical protein LJC19_01160 [Oxalobacter sp. OttesenSCG-928-P03]|nr:hypothetical protein [Oxalobacter sp. OttesenSCG-928-P03]